MTTTTTGTEARLVGITGSEKIVPPDGVKFYAPFVMIDGQLFSLMGIRRTREAANRYAARFAQKYNSLSLYAANHPPARGLRLLWVRIVDYVKGLVKYAAG